MAKHNGWCFTLNNPTGLVSYSARSMHYLVFGRERGEGGTEHFQGYVQFKTEKYMRDVKRAFGAHGDRMHLEVQRGSDDQAIAYCKKGTGTVDAPANAEVYEYGARVVVGPKAVKSQGHRTDIEDALALVKAGKDFDEVTDGAPEVVAKYGKFIKEQIHRYQLAEFKKVEFPVTVFGKYVLTEPAKAGKKRHWWFMGPADIGKTTGIQEAFDGRNIHMVAGSTEYPFEGYRDQDIIVYDDCMPKLAHLLDISNVWTIPKEVAGKVRYERRYWKCRHARTIIVLSNAWPSYKDNEAFQARFNLVDMTPGGGWSGAIDMGTVVENKELKIDPDQEVEGIEECETPPHVLAAIRERMNKAKQAAHAATAVGAGAPVEEKR